MLTLGRNHKRKDNPGPPGQRGAVPPCASFGILDALAVRCAGKGLRLPGAMLVAAASGALLGLSAPGFGQWYLAWFGLIPFFLLAAGSSGWRGAAVRGWCFGTFYNLVALSWFLKLSPPWWVGIHGEEQRTGLALIIWMLAGIWYGSVYGLLGGVVKAITDATRDGARLAFIIALPLIWVGVTHFLCNQPTIALLPVSVLEYSQFRQTGLIQICSFIGGVGLEALIVAFNLAIALMIAWFDWRIEWRELVTWSTVQLAWRQMWALVIAVAVATAWGSWRVASGASPDTTASNIYVSLVQGDFTETCNREQRELQPAEVWSQCQNYLQQCPPGIVIFSETVLPQFALADKGIRDDIEHSAGTRGCDLIIGIWEKTDDGRTYNSAILASAKHGIASQQPYRKQYLMPFGEFEPLLLKLIPPAIKRAAGIPTRAEISVGDRAVLLRGDHATVSAVICGENFDPVLCAKAVSPNETRLIVNLSNLTWFKNSAMGDLTAAGAALRAVENGRPFAYASDTGPSLVADEFGRVLVQSKWCQPGVVTVSTPLPHGRSTFFGQIWRGFLSGDILDRLPP